jgi:hypothetical protein
MSQALSETPPSAAPPLLDPFPPPEPPPLLELPPLLEPPPELDGALPEDEQPATATTTDVATTVRPPKASARANGPSADMTGANRRIFMGGLRV